VTSTGREGSVLGQQSKGGRQHMAQEGEIIEGAWTSEAQQQPAATEGSLAVALRLDDAFADEDEVDEEGLDDDERGRRRRRSRARARTISIRRLSKTELNLGRMMYPEEQYWRPQTRGECADMERPCPFVSCKYHLYIDVHPVRGSIKINFPDLEVWEMTDTCALDIADRGGITLEEVGEIMNLTRERVRQVETQGLSKLERLSEVDQLRDYVDD
jgi:hypothetical protein